MVCVQLQSERNVSRVIYGLLLRRNHPFYKLSSFFYVFNDFDNFNSRKYMPYLSALGISIIVNAIQMTSLLCFTFI